MTTKLAPRRAFRINTDDSYELFDLEFDDEKELAQCQAIVGGLIEPIALHKLGLTMWVNEEGLLKDLPVNPTASAIVAFAYQPHETIPIKGDVYLTNIQADDEGNVLGLEEETAHRLWSLMQKDDETDDAE